MNAGVNDKLSPMFAQHTAVNYVGRNEIAARIRYDIIALVISDPSIRAYNKSNKSGVTKRAIDKNIKSLRGMGILVHEGSDKAGYWRIIVKP